MPPEAPFGDENTLAIFSEVRDRRVRAVFLPLVHGGAGRHFEFDVLTVLAGAVGAFAVAAATGLEDFLETIVEQGIQVGVGDQVNRSAGPAIAAAGTAARNEL